MNAAAPNHLSRGQGRPSLRGMPHSRAWLLAALAVTPQDLGQTQAPAAAPPSVEGVQTPATPPASTPLPAAPVDGSTPEPATPEPRNEPAPAPDAALPTPPSQNVAPPATPSPPPAPPLVTPNPASAPTFPSRDFGKDQDWPDFSLELGFGMNDRLGDPDGYARASGLGAAYGVGAWFSLVPNVAAGLELSHTDLGRASSQSGANFLSTEPSMTAAWLGGRVSAYQRGDLRLFLSLRDGLALEHVAAAGVRSTASPLEPATPFDCAGTHGPALAIGAGLGSSVHLNSHLDLVLRVDGHSEQLTADSVAGCAAGIGSSTSLMFGAGFAYGLEMPRSAAEPFARGVSPARW